MALLSCDNGFPFTQFKNNLQGQISKTYAFASQVPSVVAQFFSDESLPLTHSEIIIPILDDFLIIGMSFELCEIFACHPIVFLAKWE